MPGIRNKLKSAFRSGKDNQQVSAQSSHPNVNRKLENATLQISRNERPGNSIISEDQSNSESESDGEGDISIGLWNDAYENIRNGPDEDKKKLVIAYEKVLTKLTDSGNFWLSKSLVAYN